MTDIDFENSVIKQLEYCKTLLSIKEEEYAGKNLDRLHAFKRSAAAQGITPKEALAGMMSKHTISIYDMCHGDHPLDMWKEKITDHINYLLLLKALVDEESGGVENESRSERTD